MTLDEIYRIFDSLEATVTGCKIWPLRVDKDGYGCAYLKTIPNPAKIHRIALERKLGRAIHSGMCACHSCDTPSCVNEEHLWEGTVKQNNLDASKKGRKTHREETKNMLRIKNMGSKNPRFGCKHTTLTCDKMSKLKQGHLNNMYGKKHSFDSKLRMSMQTLMNNMHYFGA